MKPYLICHMVSSIDGRILPSRWRPQVREGDLYDRLHHELGGQAWLVGRVTGQEFAKAETYPAPSEAVFPREPWIAQRGASGYGVVLDAAGKIAWGRSDIGGDPIVVILTEQVSDAHLAGLRSDGVSYLFAGETSIDLPRALEILNRELGVERLILEGGGIANGAFLREGLVDEISLIVWPTVDGAAGAPSVFDSLAADADRLAPVRAMHLLSCESMADGAVWLRYRVENG
ncbi:2-hydroxy-3-oxopropionate reductase [Sphingomonas oleivorans]|uniref:2-hydroxy-3-oxopropionate reductase n=1 Tax=Sphingomonas oleivorans TaxID=1735121 RepID=A0A2T5G347_9SPHN|nr:dihydrofolate reductase family protein [Sphingomonas oleivorans]PTQ13567.1 2-hydroxy-3-oxopropionate reductase [Sphingomonas oleivorans]